VRVVQTPEVITHGKRMSKGDAAGAYANW